MSPFSCQKNQERQQRIQASPNYRDGKFQNPVETPTASPSKDSIRDYVKEKVEKVPEVPLEVCPVQRKRILEHGSVTWFGHSTVLLNLDGKLLLTDPVFNNRPGPIRGLGPTKRFFGKEAAEPQDLPPLTAVVLSHNHYDHLDKWAIKALEKKTEVFLAPLGVGDHLEKWGIPEKKIIELDWYEETRVHELNFTATPTRHFSGRLPTDFFKTLWCSWVIQGENQKVFFSGDSGYFPGFKDIGERFGPFDFTMMECGAYSQYWPYIHMMPEESWQANLDLGSKLMMPIHWGKYSLSLHSWTEPVERLLAVAEEEMVATPRIGESFVLGGDVPGEKWWER